MKEFLEPLGLSVYRLSKELNVPTPRINDVARGERSISAETAIRLGTYF
ncbi:MAG TPA: HigA family addiction module antitoxin [Acidisarcina sp.]